MPCLKHTAIFEIDLTQLIREGVCQCLMAVCGQMNGVCVKKKSLKSRKVQRVVCSASEAHIRLGYRWEEKSVDALLEFVLDQIV